MHIVILYVYLSFYTVISTLGDIEVLLGGKYMFVDDKIILYLGKMFYGLTDKREIEM